MKGLGVCNYFLVIKIKEGGFYYFKGFEDWMFLEAFKKEGS